MIKGVALWLVNWAAFVGLMALAVLTTAWLWPSADWAVAPALAVALLLSLSAGAYVQYAAVCLFLLPLEAAPRSAGDVAPAIRVSPASRHAHVLLAPPGLRPVLIVAAGASLGDSREAALLSRHSWRDSGARHLQLAIAVAALWSVLLPGWRGVHGTPRFLIIAACYVILSALMGVMGQSRPPQSRLSLFLAPTLWTKVSHAR